MEERFHLSLQLQSRCGSWWWERHQELWGSLEVGKQRKRTGSGAKLSNLKACPKWCTSSSKVPPPKGYIICPNTNSNWAPGVYTHNPMGVISSANHSTSARKHISFLHGYTPCSTWVQASRVESCLLAILLTPIVTYQLSQLSVGTICPVCLPCLCLQISARHKNSKIARWCPDTTMASVWKLPC